MRLGISSYTYGWAIGTDGNRPQNALTAFDLLDRAAELNVRVLQLCDNLPADTYSDESLEAIATVAARLGIQLELGTRGIDPEHLRRFALAAHRLGSPILRVVIDTAQEQPTIDQIVARMTQVLPVFEKHRVVLAIENHDRLGVRQLAGIIRQIDSPQVGICLDTANSFGALEGPAAVVETLGPYAVNLHLKDIAVQRFPHAQGFVVEGRPAGEGLLDIPWVLKRLREFGRDLNAIVELWTPPEVEIEQTIRKEAQWAQLSVKTMRQWINQ